MSGFYGLRTPQIKVVLQQARVVRVNFASSGRDQMLDLWNSALKRRVWETKPVEKVRKKKKKENTKRKDVVLFLGLAHRKRFVLMELEFLGCCARQRNDLFLKRNL